MKEKPEQKETPDSIARDWLYSFERHARDRDFIGAGKLFHANCVYYGLEDDRRNVDWSLTWKSQLNFSIDIAQAKIIPEGNSMFICAPWIAQGLIHGSEPKLGRVTIMLMRFSNEKLLCTHYHCSRQPTTT